MIRTSKCWVFMRANMWHSTCHLVKAAQSRLHRQTSVCLLSGPEGTQRKSNAASLENWSRVTCFGKLSQGLLSHALTIEQLLWQPHKILLMPWFLVLHSAGVHWDSFVTGKCRHRCSIAAQRMVVCVSQHRRCPLHSTRGSSAAAGEGTFAERKSTAYLVWLVQKFCMLCISLYQQSMTSLVLLG